MKIQTARALAAALISLGMAAASSSAFADVKDYEFQLVEQAVKANPEAVIAVRLINRTTGKLVPGAIIFASRLDMAPDSMPEMTTKIAPLPSTEPGVYRFKADVSMAGGWRLSLGAKVQGETGAVEGKLVIKAQK